jgi:8-oxo-dGTP diphosphatase
MGCVSRLVPKATKGPASGVYTACPSFIALRHGRLQAFSTIRGVDDVAAIPMQQVEVEVAGRRLRLTTVLSDIEPPAEAVTAAHCFAFDGDQIVLARHVDRDWTIPGGHVEVGETPLEAMRREAREEAGIEVDSPRFIAWERIEAADGEEPDPRYPNPGYQVFYVARVVRYGEITHIDECSEARSFSPNEARRAPGWVQRNTMFYEAALARRPQ